MGTRITFPSDKACRGAMLTTHFHLVASGAIPLPLHTFKMWCLDKQRSTMPFTFCLTNLSLFQTTEFWMIGWWVNNEFEIPWNKVMVIKIENQFIHLINQAMNQITSQITIHVFYLIPYWKKLYALENCCTLMNQVFIVMMISC